MTIPQHRIMTILGSTKFRREILHFAWRRTKEGYLVLFAPFAKEEMPQVEDHREILESIHYQKIRMADIIVVYNPNGYIGTSTKEEMEYAKSLNKSFWYLEPLKEEDA